MDSLEWLPSLYGRVWIPHEVIREIAAGGAGNPESHAIAAIDRLIQIPQQQAPLPEALRRELDSGEAGVIHTALENGIDTVAIDEKAGRRVARIHGLKVTGSLGILLKAKNHGLIPSLGVCISRMRERGIWMSDELVVAVMQQAGEA
jgi:predicted nucleic acid-binding protein